MTITNLESRKISFPGLAAAHSNGRFSGYRFNMVSQFFTLVFVVFLATLNIGVGFGTAIFLNRGPRKWREGIGARWRFKVAIILGRRRASLNADRAPQLSSAAPEGNEKESPKSDRDDPSQAKQSSLSLAPAQIQAFERQLSDIVSQLGRISEDSKIADVEVLAETAERCAQSFLQSINNLLLPLMQENDGDLSETEQMRRIHNSCEELWHQVNEKLTQIFGLQLIDLGATASATALRSSISAMQSAISAAKLNLDRDQCHRAA